MALALYSRNAAKEATDRLLRKNVPNVLAKQMWLAWLCECNQAEILVGHVLRYNKNIISRQDLLLIGKFANRSLIFFPSETLLPYNDRLPRLPAHRFGLWDMLAACEREGSGDRAHASLPLFD